MKAPTLLLLWRQLCRGLACLLCRRRVLQRGGALAVYRVLPPYRYIGGERERERMLPLDL